MLNKLYKKYRNYKKKQYNKKIRKTAKRVGEDLHVNNPSIVTGNTVLGDNVNFNGMEVLGTGEVDIGDNFHSGVDCMIITDIHNYDGGNAIPYDESIISKDVVIRDNVWLGHRVIILGGVTIGEGAIIQAGSTVVHDIPDFSIAGGHPASVFKMRDVEHYNKLKDEGKFH